MARGYAFPRETIWFRPLGAGPPEEGPHYGPFTRCELVADLALQMKFNDYVPQGQISVTGPVSAHTTPSIADPDPHGLGDLIDDAEQLGEWWSDFLVELEAAVATAGVRSPRLAATVDEELASLSSSSADDGAGAPERRL